MRASHRHGEIALRLFGRWTLLRFGAAEIMVDEHGVLARLAITGGLLARTAGGSITFSQSPPPHVQLRATIDGFFPRLGRRPGGPVWSGGLYRHVQQRIHTSISRRYFARLIDEERSMRVVVFGATGTIGQALVPVLARDPRRRRHLAHARSPTRAT